MADMDSADTVLCCGSIKAGEASGLYKLLRKASDAVGLKAVMERRMKDMIKALLEKPLSPSLHRPSYGRLLQPPDHPTQMQRRASGTAIRPQTMPTHTTVPLLGLSAGLICKYSTPNIYFFNIYTRYVLFYLLYCYIIVKICRHCEVNIFEISAFLVPKKALFPDWWPWIINLPTWSWKGFISQGVRKYLYQKEECKPLSSHFLLYIWASSLISDVKFHAHFIRQKC